MPYHSSNIKSQGLVHNHISIKIPRKTASISAYEANQETELSVAAPWNGWAVALDIWIGIVVVFPLAKPDARACDGFTAALSAAPAEVLIDPYAGGEGNASKVGEAWSADVSKSLPDGF
jgi:hypothetical protein